MALSWILHLTCHVLGYPDHSPGGTTSVKHEIIVLSSDKNHPRRGDAVESLKVNKALGAKRTDTADSCGFQMPLHYPRYTKKDYDNMEEWRVDKLLRDYGLNSVGTLDEKRAYAMGAFLWPGQY